MINAKINRITIQYLIKSKLNNVLIFDRIFIMSRNRNNLQNLIKLFVFNNFIILKRMLVSLYVINIQKILK